MQFKGKPEMYAKQLREEMVFVQGKYAIKIKEFSD